MNIPNNDKVSIHKLTDVELNGHSVKDVQCRACSGYGACGYKSFSIYEGDNKPYAVCGLQVKKILNELRAED